MKFDEIGQNRHLFRQSLRCLAESGRSDVYVRAEGCAHEFVAEVARTELRGDTYDISRCYVDLGGNLTAVAGVSILTSDVLEDLSDLPGQEMEWAMRRMVVAALGMEDAEGLFLDGAHSREVEALVESASIGFSDALRVFDYHRLTGEFTWEIIATKSAHEMAVAVAAEVDPEAEAKRYRAYHEIYADFVRNLVVSYGEGRRLFDWHVGEDNCAVLILAQDEGEEIPTWRLLPEPMEVGELEQAIDDIARYTFECGTYDNARGFRKRVLEQRESALALVREYEEFPIVFIAEDRGDYAVLVRYVNEDEEPPLIEHIWEDRISAGRRV